MATLTFYPSAFDSEHAYASVNSSYPTTNPIGKNSSNSTYTQINLKTGSNAETYFYYNFDCSKIPSGATINSVYCSARAYCSTAVTSYVASNTMQLYSGSVAKGSATTIGTGGNPQNMSVGTWTYDELQSARIRCYAKRGTGRTSNTYYLRFYGATLTVEYTDNTPKYNVSVESTDGSITTDKTGDNEVREGSSFTVSIFGTIGTITDNGENVVGSLIEEIAQEETIVSYPTSYTTSGSVRGTNYTGAIGQGSSNTATGNDYCSSQSSTATITYSFDFSSIPSNATIKSVSVVVGGHYESASGSSEVADLQLYSGSTAKGSKSSFTSASKQLVTMDAGTWTRDELQDAKLQFTIGYYGGLVNGVDFTVVYLVEVEGGVYHTYTITSVAEAHTIVIGTGETTSALYFKNSSGKYIVLKATYQKVNGSYVSVDPSTLSTSTKYVLKT